MSETLPETYCLGLLVSELGETLQVLGNALRFGIDTPDKGATVARFALANEIGDVLAATDFAILQGVVDSTAVATSRHNKLRILLDPTAIDNLRRRLAPALPQATPPTFVPTATPARPAPTAAPSPKTEDERPGEPAYALPEKPRRPFGKS